MTSWFPAVKYGKRVLPDQIKRLTVLTGINASYTRLAGTYVIEYNEAIKYPIFIDGGY